MNISSNMNDAELKKFIEKGEQFFYEPGELYSELIDAGYSKEKIDALISAKKKKESNSFKVISLFVSMVFTCLGVLSIIGYFGKGIFGLLTGFLFCMAALGLIKLSFK